MIFALSVVVSFLSILGIVLTGRRRWEGWVVGLVAQLLFIGLILATATDIAGVLAESAFVVPLYARHAWDWRQEEVGNGRSSCSRVLR